MRRFKQLTTGHSVIMGRKTYDTLPKPLPNRRNLVITRDAAYHAPGAEVFHSLDAALATSSTEDEVFIAGGQQIYEIAISRADRIYLTVVHTTLDGDTSFPDFLAADWRLDEDLRFQSDAKHAYAYSFRLYTRRFRDN
jgi:dihydrofolate reductase